MKGLFNRYETAEANTKPLDSIAAILLKLNFLDFSTAFSGYSKSEDAEFDVPETSYETVASSINENTRPEQENVDLGEDFTELNDQSVSVSKSSVDADQSEQSDYQPHFHQIQKRSLFTSIFSTDWKTES